MITGYNNLTLEVYAKFSTTRILDTDGDLLRAQNIVFDNFYPGGLYGTCSFTVMRDPNRSWLFKQGQRLVVRNGLQIVWEGEITSPGYGADSGTQARTILAVGFWGTGLLGTTGLRKPWADTRLTSSVWVQQEVSAYQLASLDTTARLRIYPKDNLRWNAAQYFGLRYTAPTGQTVKRVKYNYDFSKTATVLPNLIFYFSSNASTYTKITASYDGDPATSTTIAAFLATPGIDYLYVGMNAGDTDKLQPGDTASITITMGNVVNAVNSVMTAEYWSGGGWTALTITDGTAAAGKTLAQSGSVTFSKPGNMGAVALNDANSSVKIWVRLSVSVNLTANIKIAEFTFGLVMDWYVVLYNVGLAAEIAATKINSTSTGSIDNTLATPSQAVELRLVSNVQQTPWGNGTIHGEFTSVVVYADANTITASEVVKDWISNVGNLNSDTSQVASNTLSVEPWITGSSLDFEMGNSNLARLAALGDASFNGWAAQIIDSEQAATPSGKPLLSFQQQPALSDYDYSVTLGAGTLQTITVLQTPIYNDIIISYTDAGGVTQWLTSADDATLTDATSAALYGTFQVTLQASTTSSAVATGLAKRYLAQNKDPHFYVSGSIPVTGYILGKTGNPIPASFVKPGKRLKVLNFLTDEVGVSAAGLIFIISHISYDDASETVSIDCGVPDDLSVMVAQLAQGIGVLGINTVGAGVAGVGHNA